MAQEPRTVDPRSMGASQEGAQMGGSVVVRFDFACKKCEGTFTIWSDSAKVCPLCGSRRIFKVFLTPTAYNSGKAAVIEKLAEKQLDAAGLSNYTNAGGRIRRTRKTDPTQLAAERAARANNIPIQTGPAMKGVEGRIQTMREEFRKLGANGYLKAMGAQGKTQVTSSPRGTGAVVDSLIKTGRQVAPLHKAGERIYHKDAKEESAKLAKLMGR